MSPDCGAKLSAIVISYNRERIVGTCLRALAFADEVIVVDKSSTDRTREIAAPLADRVVKVPWSPTVEGTRDYAVSLAAHDWVLCLDDDECLSAEAALFIRAELRNPRADVYYLAQRHYILGAHDDRAYYWPESQMKLFRRGSVEFRGQVHGGICVHSDRVYIIPPDDGTCMHHLSHRNAAEWVEKTNRYTSEIDRVRVHHEGSDLIAFAHARIDHWASATRGGLPSDYPAAVAVLRALYDIVDRVKIWEEQRGSDGDAMFAAKCADLEAEYVERLAGIAQPPRRGTDERPPPALAT